MKHFCVTVIVLALIAADYLSTNMSAHEHKGWAVTDTVAILFAGVWFYHHRDKS